MSRHLSGIFLFLFVLLQSIAMEALQPWTWTFKKKFQTHVLEAGESAFRKEHVPPFTQLLFSWNALRPQKGIFRFLVRVRYADTKKWSSWHKMVEWGASIQKSFYNADKDGLTYKHVRFELPTGRAADGFDIKVVALGGADLADVKMLAVSLAHFKSFMKEKTTDRYRRVMSVMVQGVPMRSQMFLKHPEAEYLCSPTALGMVVEFMNGTAIDPVAFANGVYDQGLKVYGSWPFNTAHAFEAAQGNTFFHVQRFHSFGTLYHYVARGIPVVVSIRGVLDGAPKTNFDGHLLVVVGYDAQTESVICHDSAVGYGLRVSAGKHLDAIPIPKNVLRKYPLDNFLDVWEQRHRLAYVADRGFVGEQV